MKPQFSILHATLGRPEKAARAMCLWRDRAREPKAVEYIVAVNSDDSTIPKLYQAFAEVFDPAKAFWGTRMVGGEFKGSAEAWNEAAKGCHGEILIQGQDDIEPPQDWDVSLSERYLKEASDRVFIAVSDGYRTGKAADLCCTAIMSRGYAEMEGHFLFPGYLSVYSDDDVTIRALGNAKEGKSVFVDARDLVFRHRHHYHDKAVPFDVTYAKENSDEAYKVGQTLFTARNKRFLEMGLKTW